MKSLMFAALAGMVMLSAGCVSTVSDTSSPALTWSTDKINARYQRSVDQVYQAAVTVIQNNGVVLTEYIPHDTTNSLPSSVRSLYGKVDKRNIWISVQPVDTKITQVTVQARTRAGFRDQDLTHELEKEIALQLQSMR